MVRHVEVEWWQSLDMSRTRGSCSWLLLTFFINLSNELVGKKVIIIKHTGDASGSRCRCISSSPSLPPSSLLPVVVLLLLLPLSLSSDGGVVVDAHHG